MKKLLVGCGVVAVGFVILVVAALIYIGTVGPGTAVVSGRQLEQRFLDKVHELGLLQEGETIQYFYSDAMVDIAGGLYLVTDRHVILYNDQWPEPRIILPFEEVTSLEASYDDSFFVDSTLTLGLPDGSSISFPVSSEQGGDRRVFEYIDQRRPKGDEEAPDLLEAEGT